MSARTLETRNLCILLCDGVASTTRSVEARKEGTDTAYFENLIRYLYRWRDLLEASGGRKQNFTGDGWLFTFDDPTKTLPAIQNAHRTMQADPLHEVVPLRFGVHFGQVHIAKDGNVASADINICAKIMGKADRYQVVLSAPAYELVRFYRREIELHSIGELSIEGLPIPLYMLCLPGAPPPPPPLTPWTIPSPSQHYFFGRDDDLARLHDALFGTDRRPVALVGMGGCGKTQLAVRYAWTHRTDYPGGGFWINARDTLHLTHDFAALGRFLGVPEDLPTEERAERVRLLLSEQNQPSLLILDDATRQTALDLPPPGGECRILVTTRFRHLVRPRCRIEALAGLEMDAAIALLQLHHKAMTEEERKAARKIADMLDCLPMAMELVANYVERHGLSFAAYLERLSTLRERLDKRPLEPVRDAIDISHNSLTPPAPAILAAASCFARRDISSGLLLAACDVDSEEAFMEALADLRDFSLIYREEDTFQEKGARYSVHALVQAYAQGRMNEDERRATAARVASVLTGHLQGANERKDWSGIRRELAHCHAAASCCEESGARAACWPLLREIGIYLFEHGDAPAAAVRLHKALQMAEAQPGHHPQDMAFLFRLYGEVQQSLQHAQKALHYVQKALSIAEALLPPDAPELADYNNSVGYALRMQGKLENALPFYRKALEISEKACGRRSPQVAACLNNIGALYEARKEWDAAQSALNEALKIDEAVYGPGHLEIAILLNNSGRVLWKQAKFQEALQRHTAALHIYETTFGHQNRDVAMSLYYLGNALRGLGDHEAAEQNQREAFAILERLYGPHHFLTNLVRKEMEREPPAE